MDKPLRDRGSIWILKAPYSKRSQTSKGYLFGSIWINMAQDTPWTLSCDMSPSHRPNMLQVCAHAPCWTSMHAAFIPRCHTRRRVRCHTHAPFGFKESIGMAIAHQGLKRKGAEHCEAHLRQSADLARLDHEQKYSKYNLHP